MSADGQRAAWQTQDSPVQGRLVTRLLVPALLFTLLWLLATIPAYWALAAAGPNLAASGISGTVWRGTAGSLMLRMGETWLALGETHWRLLPLVSLRSGALCIGVESRLAEQAMQGQVCALSGNRLQVTNLELELPAAATQLPGGLQLAGSVLLQVESLRMQDAQLQRVAARGSWEGAALHDGRRWIDLGTLGMQTVDENTLVGLRQGFPEWQLFDVSGPLQLDLRAGMDAGGRLRLAGEASPRASAAPALVSILDFVAAGRSGEAYRIAL